MTLGLRKGPRMTYTPLQLLEKGKKEGVKGVVVISTRSVYTLSIRHLVR